MSQTFNKKLKQNWQTPPPSGRCNKGQWSFKSHIKLKNTNIISS